MPLLLGKQGLRAGRHTFTITAQGYQPARVEAEVVADRVVELDVELVRQ